MKLLHIDSSILGENSVTRQLSAAIVERLQRAGPTREVTHRDLAAEPLPHLTLGHLPSDAVGDGPVSQAVLDEFLAADIVVVGAPMYNFTLPSQLKAWLDRILIAGTTFRYGPQGPEGLAGGKRVIVAIARGGLYGPGAPSASFEHLETYLRAVFAFIGIVPEVIVAEGVKAGLEQRSSALNTALEAVSVLQAAPVLKAA
jgi:FMN-dependent NADH-azoreductase